MRRIVAVISLALAASVGLLAAPASAATASFVLSDCGLALKDQTFNVAEGDNLQLTFTSCSMIRVGGSSPDSFTAAETIGQNTYSVTGSTINGFGPQGGPLVSGTQTIYFTDNGNLSSQTAFGSFTVVIGGGGSSDDANSTGSSSALSPVLETLSLALEANGAACAGGNPTGYSGAWLAMPKAEDCKQTGPNAKAGAKLLGWSTHANFPVATAQSQVDKGWGAIDGDFGGVRMIFIPAGMSTFVSGGNTLYPVWSV